MKAFRVTLFVVIFGMIYFFLLPENEQASYFSGKEKVSDVTITSLTELGDQPPKEPSENKYSNFGRVAAELETDSRQTVEEQLKLLNELEKNNPGMLSDLVQRDLAVKGKLTKLYESNRSSSFESQLEIVENTLAAFSLTDDEQFFYARYYFLRHEQPDHFDVEKALAVKFLTDSKAQRVIASIEKRELQLTQREQYQKELQVFTAKLEKQREEKFLHLNEVEWQRYQQEQLKLFKRNYFQQ